MNPQPRSNKAFPTLAAALSALLALAGCASEPSAPSGSNSAPEVLDLNVSGSRPVIAAGTSNLLLQATTTDVDGDALTFTWSGDGVFHDADDTAKTVRWDVPSGSYGDLSVTCTASDGAATGSRTETFAVGRSLSGSDYGDLVGDTITWGSSDAPFYILQGNVEIPAGVTLQIEAGTTVWCDANKLLTIGGNLVAEGTSGAKVNFQSWLDENEDPGYWDGISFQSGSGQLDLQFCNIRNANVALDLSQGSGAGASIVSCGFFYSSSALLVRFAEPSIHGCTTDGCSKGFDIDLGSRVEIANCTFRNLVDPALIIRGASTGRVEGCFFTDFSPPAISLTGGTYVDFHDNSFLGTDQVFNVGSGGYAADPEPLDARCNFWGDGVISSDIAGRIVRAAGAPSVVYEPWKAESGADCGGVDGPQLASGVEVIWDARHPLYGDPPAGIDFTTVLDDGYPRLLRIEVDAVGQAFLHDYVWTTSGGGSFFATATDWPDFPPEEIVSYPGQADAVDGSEIFFVAETGASGETIGVTVTDNWGLSDSASRDFAY